MAMKNPLFIPRGFEETREGNRIKYCRYSIKGRDVRIIEYRSEKGLLHRVNVWGICGKLEALDERFVAYDIEIDVGTFKELKGPVEAMYAEAKPVITFF